MSAVALWRGMGENVDRNSIAHNQNGLLGDSRRRARLRPCESNHFEEERAMQTLALVLATLLALLHVYILVLEMFSGPSPSGAAPLG